MHTNREKETERDRRDDAGSSFYKDTRKQTRQIKEPDIDYQVQFRNILTDRSQNQCFLLHLKQLDIINMFIQHLCTYYNLGPH